MTPETGQFFVWRPRLLAWSSWSSSRVVGPLMDADWNLCWASHLCDESQQFFAQISIASSWCLTMGLAVQS